MGDNPQGFVFKADCATQYLLAGFLSPKFIIIHGVSTMRPRMALAAGQEPVSRTFL